MSVLLARVKTALLWAATAMIASMLQDLTGFQKMGALPRPLPLETITHSAPLYLLIGAGVFLAVLCWKRPGASGWTRSRPTPGSVVKVDRLKIQPGKGERRTKRLWEETWRR